MALITDQRPETWKQLEELVFTFLIECGMDAQNGVSLPLPRGSVDVDVLADERLEGISYRIICECKNWKANVSRDVVHAFRTVMQETGANRGYIISTSGFQTGAVEAAHATNVELVTFEQFQELHFDKWINRRIKAVEQELRGFHTYYEPLGPPGYAKLESDEERAAYDAVWDRYLFAGLMLQPFSPYIRMMGAYPFPDLPFDCAELDARGVPVPDEVRAAKGYREFLGLLVKYGLEGREALRAVNPITRERSAEAIDRED